MSDGENGMAPLDGAQHRDLARRLTKGLTPFEFESLTYAATGDQVYRFYTSDRLPLEQQIYETLGKLESDGTTERFLAWVYREKKYNRGLRDYILSLAPSADGALTGQGLDLQRKGTAVAKAPRNPFAPGLQTYVRPKGMLDLGLWVRRLLAIERQVCVVEHGGDARGTGFLVGPRAVLTNWHVVETALGSGAAAAAITCRFDYELMSDRSVPSGLAVTVEAVAASSPYAPAERTGTPGTPPPTAAELDYALLLLPDGFAAGRGHVRMPSVAAELEDDAAILIVQHPRGAPMKLAMDLDSAMGLDPSGFRFRYRTSTDEGSSGSPCFAIDWGLVALHHSGDPAILTRYPTFNEGIPAYLVRGHIARTAAGSALLGA